mmetsp:Transcript_42447/g.49522  ORF Transcript_42447/g.49522 Transcript_42447/m.49522 type:complete len:82 (-) Transcript_42447:163-408(-)
MRIILKPNEQRLSLSESRKNSKANKRLNTNDQSGALALADRHKNEAECGWSRDASLNNALLREHAQTDPATVNQLGSPTCS